MFHDQRHNGGPAPDSQDHTRVAEVRRFKLTEAVVEDGRREIEVEGELDLAVADRLRQAIASSPSDQILISLRSCGFIDSAGIAVILKANNGNKSRVVLHSPCGQVLRLLEVTGLTSNGLVFPDREQALSAAAHPGRAGLR
jgi:anti-anti-sigma factor